MCQVAEVENVCCPIDRYDYRADSQQRQEDTHYKMIQPPLWNWFLKQSVSVSIVFYQSCHATYCQYACELHSPPNEHLNTEQSIAKPWTNDTDNKDNKRDISVKNITTRNVVVMATYDRPLPYRTNEQYRREDKVYEVIWYKNDTECYDQETYDN